MASRVANMQHAQSSRTSSPRRVIVDDPRFSSGGGSYPPRTSEERGSYNGRPTVRYSRRSIDEDRKREREHRDRDRDRDRERDRERERPRYERSAGGGGGRGSDEYLREAERGASSARSRSYDPGSERVRGSTRYVEGASGRRYPSKVPWQQ
jgi:hypothetical protein